RPSSSSSRATSARVCVARVDAQHASLPKPGPARVCNPDTRPPLAELVGRFLGFARPADLRRRRCAVRGGWDLPKVQPGMVAGAVQLLADKLANDLLDELGDRGDAAR